MLRLAKGDGLTPPVRCRKTARTPFGASHTTCSNPITDPAGPLFAGIAWRSIQLHWHRYQVTTVPPGGRVLAFSELTKVQAWALGLRTYGIQYHPETFPETLERWADDEPEGLLQGGLTRSQLRASTEEHYPTSARLADRLFESMALLVMPLDRRYAGIVKDLHH